MEKGMIDYQHFCFHKYPEKLSQVSALRIFFRAVRS